APSCYRYIQLQAAHPAPRRKEMNPFAFCSYMIRQYSLTGSEPERTTIIRIAGEPNKHGAGWHKNFWAQCNKSASYVIRFRLDSRQRPGRLRDRAGDLAGVGHST